MAKGGLLGSKIAGLPVPVVIVGGVVIGYVLYSRYKKAGASAAPAAASSGSSGGALSDAETSAAIYQVGQQSAAANQQLAAELQTEFQTLEQQIAQMMPTPTSSTPPPPPATGGTSSAASPGMGIVQTAKGPMIWLGNWGSPHYQVGGGAPVYFGNAETLAEGPQAEVPGADIYTPVAYSSLVSSAPS